MHDIDDTQQMPDPELWDGRTIDDPIPFQLASQEPQP